MIDYVYPFNGLTLAEFESLVAGAQAAPIECEHEYDNPIAVMLHAEEWHDGIKLADLPGTWSLDINGHHALLVQTGDVWYSDAFHVGLVEGACDETCRGMLRDMAAAKRLRQVVKECGLRWKLQGGSNYGEPEYVSAVGYVNCAPWFENSDYVWTAGDLEGSEIKGKFKTYRQAMRAVVAHFDSEYWRSTKKQ